MVLEKQKPVLIKVNWYLATTYPEAHTINTEITKTLFSDDSEIDLPKNTKQMACRTVTSWYNNCYRCIKLDNSIGSIHHCEAGIEITETNKRLNQLPLLISMRELEGGEDKGRENTASLKTFMTTTAVRQGEH